MSHCTPQNTNNESENLAYLIIAAEYANSMLEILREPYDKMFLSYKYPVYEDLGPDFDKMEKCRLTLLYTFWTCT